MIRSMVRRMIVWAMKDYDLDGNLYKIELAPPRFSEPFVWPSFHDCPLSILEFSELPPDVRQRAANTRDFDKANRVIADWKRQKDAAEDRANAEFRRRFERHLALAS